MRIKVKFVVEDKKNNDVSLGLTTGELIFLIFFFWFIPILAIYTFSYQIFNKTYWLKESDFYIEKLKKCKDITIKDKRKKSICIEVS